MGDINVDNLKDDDKKKKLENALMEYGIRRLELPPTRITHNSQTSIDCICTNIDDKEINTKIETTGLSDHTAQICHIDRITKNNADLISKKRRFNQHTMEHLRLILQAQDWSCVMNQNSTDTAFYKFSEVFQNALNFACPYTSTRQKRKPIKNLWDTECTTLKNSYLLALNRSIITGLPEDKLETANRKKTYDLKLKTLRRQHTAQCIEESDNKPKALWKIINGERKGKAPDPIQQSLTSEGEIITYPLKISDYFNKYFVTTAERTLTNNSVTIEQRLPAIEPQHETGEGKLQLYKTNHAELNKTIDALKPKTSAGEDDISSKLAKYCKNEIITPLIYIINKSFSEGVFPDGLKLSKVYPKHKSGPIDEASSYRPISLVPTFSKIMEKVALKRLLDHLTKNKLLTPNQHGFIRGRSTTTAIAHLIESIVDKLEKGRLATGLFLDFSKAFDCLSHNLIIKKLTTLGVTGKETKWFKSYLSNRKQLVELTHRANNTTCRVKSHPLHITRGVPQGSVLGPVLYILMTNDLPNHLQDFCKTVMYADDTALILGNSNKDQLDIDTFVAIEMTKQYCNKNDLVLNETKTQQLIFTATANNLDGLPDLDTTNTAKYLGVTIDNTLSWKPHVDKLCLKLSSSNYVIRRIKQISDIQTAKTAYYALFESHTRYGLIAWGGTTATNLQRVLMIQKRAVRSIAGLKYRDSCRTAFRDLKILTVVALYVLQTILYAISTGQTRHANQHQHYTRNRRDFTLAPHQLSLYGKKPSYAGAVFFNTLPDHLKRHPENGLKTAVTQWLLERPFYNLREFLEWRKREETTTVN